MAYRDRYQGSRMHLPLQDLDSEALRLIQLGSSARKKAPAVRAVLRKYARLLAMAREAKTGGLRVALVAYELGQPLSIKTVLDADLDLEV